MKLISRVILVLVTLMLGLMMFGCISTSVPNGKKRAKKRLRRSTELMQDILKEHPYLADSTKKIVHDTIIIEAVRVDTEYVAINDSVATDSLLQRYSEAVLGLDNARSREREVWDVGRPSASKRKSPTQLQNEVKQYEKVVQRLSKELISKTYKDTTYVYEDSLLSANICLEDGKIILQYETKDQKHGYIKEETNVSLNVAKGYSRFYEDWMFWVLIGVVVLLLILFRRKS